LTARTLFSLLDAAYLLALLAWGACLVASTRGGARPGLAVLGATAGSVALASFTSGVLVMPEYRGWRSFLQILLILAGLLAMIGLANRREPGAKANGVLAGVLIVLAALLIGRATRTDPSSAGIIEPTIEERARLRFERAAAQPEARP
jgi:hypothetical protein